MKRIILATLLTVLTACDIPAPNHGYGLAYDEQTALGISLRNDTASDPDFDPVRIDSMASETFSCAASVLQKDWQFTDVTWQKLYIILTPELLTGNNANAEYYIHKPPLIAVVQKSKRNHARDFSVRHELLHFILAAFENQLGHDHYIFALCVY